MTNDASLRIGKALFTGFVLLCALSAGAGPKYAPIMPRAQQSLLLELTAADARVLAAGERGHVLFSDDNGDSWTQAQVPTTQMLTGLHFATAQRGWAVGHDGLVLVSDDAGATWRVQRDGLAAQAQLNIEIREQAHRELQRLETEIEATPGDVPMDLAMALEDAQLDLEDAELALEEDVFTSALLDVWFEDENTGWAVGAFGAFLGTRDGGATWTSQAGLIDNPDEFHLNAVTGDGRGRILIAGEGGMLFRSLDSGASWETIEPFYEGSWFGAIYLEGRDRLFVFGLRGNLYRSDDFGTSWQTIASDSHVTLSGGAARDDRVVLVGGVGTLLLSEDGGDSFRTARLPDRLGLAAALFAEGTLVLSGQGGVKTQEVDKLYGQ